MKHWILSTIPMLSRARGQMRWALCLSLFCSGVSLFAAGTSATKETRSKNAPSGPLSPEESLQHFELHPGCRIELVAAEPEVIDPVHISFDEQGRLWVVEYSDYPNGPSQGEPGRSRIRVLTDRDGDGRYESSTIFAEKLLFATGLLHWKDGVLVTTAGAVLFMRDTNGDGRMDDSQEWFTGFKQENPQLRANHPTLGLDNHIYIASGLRGGEGHPGKDWAKVWGQDGRQPPKPVSLSGRDFRFDPHTGDFEAVTGAGQFGLTFDDNGNRFLCSNRNPCKQVLLEEPFLKRNPLVGIRQTYVDVSPAGEASRLYPISRAWTTSNLHANQFTAACGICIYRGDALPQAMYGNAFVCDPTGNLVHRDVLSPAGATFTSRPGRSGVEFLASPDEWFRPVNLTTGPDGALYVCDMYRAVIEHPQFMPSELKNRPDLLYGTDRGRIYRICRHEGSVPADSLAAARVDKIPDYVRLLEHTNAWHRELAHRKILESRDPASIGMLKDVLSKSLSPQARIHALWLLHALDGLTPELIVQGLTDGHAGVQRQAVRLAGLRHMDQPEIQARIIQLAQQATDGGLRFELALTIPEWNLADPAEALLAVLDRPPYDPWLTTAVLTAPSQMGIAALQRRRALPASIQRVGRTPDFVFADLYRMAGRVASPKQIGALLRTSHSDHAMIQLAEGVKRRGKTFSSLLPELEEESANFVRAWLQQAHQIALSADHSRSERITAVQALYHDDWMKTWPTIQQILQNETDAEIYIAAIEVIAARRQEKIGTTLVEEFSAKTPRVRSAILAAMTASHDRVQLLLEEIEAGRISPRLIDAVRVRLLTRHKNPDIQNRAKTVFASLTPKDREKVLTEYRDCLKLKADPMRGRAVFQKNCITCHKIGDLGVDVAPDISDSGTKTPEYLLTAILDPNRAIDNNYFSYTIIDSQGRTHTGIVSGETATSVTLKQPEGKIVTLLRSEIEVMNSNGISLMPEGLEKNITKQQMADLVSFIKNWRYLDGSVPKEVIR